MSINKKIIIASILFVIFMISIAIFNIKHTDTSISLNDKIKILPTNNYNLEIKPISKDDIIVKVRTMNDIRQSNNSISIKAQITDVYSGKIDKEIIYIYDKNSYYKAPDANEYISVYSNNILMPNKEYYVILQKLTYRFFYMNINSYRLKDDLSVFNFDSEYIIANENNKYTFSDLINYQYIFTNQEQVNEYLLRKQALKNYIRS